MKNGQIIWRALFDLWGEKRLWHLKINRVPEHSGWKISSYNVDIKYVSEKVTMNEEKLSFWNEEILQVWLHRINERLSHWAVPYQICKNTNWRVHSTTVGSRLLVSSSPRSLSDFNELPLSPHLINLAQLPSNPNSPKHTNQLFQEVWHLPVGRMLTDFRNEGGPHQKWRLSQPLWPL